MPPDSRLEGTFNTRVSPSCSVGRGDRRGVGWRGRTHSPAVPSFLLAEHLREDVSWRARSSWAQPNPALMGFREAADQIFAESRVPLLPGRPATLQPRTRMCTRAHTLLSTQICKLLSRSLFKPMPAPFN